MSRDLARRLEKEFPRRLVSTRFSRERYSHDAGMQWETPVAVATPASTADVAALVRFATRHDLPLTGRGAGSSIAGNAFGSGLVIDFSRRMNKILGYDRATETIRVQPGAVLLAINRSLRRHKRRIGPSPSSEAFCTAGGMVGNNAAGSHSLLYGATAENVAGLEAVLHDAAPTQWSGPLPRPETPLQRKLFRLARSFDSPWPKTAKNSSGYLLDRLGRPGAWHPHRIFCGAEGTLGLVTEVTFRTHPMPASTATLLLGFDSTETALSDVPALLRKRPAAIELVDEDAIDVLKRKHPALPASATGSACSLVVDLFAHNGTALRQAVASMLRATRHATTRSVAYAARDRAALWTARRDVEPLLRALPGRRRPLPFVEDVVVPVPEQVGYVRALRRLLAREALAAPLYGHAGQGNLHVRPFLDLRDPEERRRMDRLNLAVARLARRLGGSLTGEHGDGYLRTRFLRQLYPRAYAQFRAVKALFDPAGLFNPGKIVETERTTRPRLLLEGPRYTAPKWI